MVVDSSMESKESKSIAVETQEIHKDGGNEETFFPFQDDQERHQIHLRNHTESFPKLGIGALAGALFLMASSGAVLLVIQGPGKVVSDWTVHVPKTNRYVTIPKPAAWLSGILSAISVCFHIALSEGLNVAWWYYVRRENTTVRDLHKIWGHGTSTWTVCKSASKDFVLGVVSLTGRIFNRNAWEQPYRLNSDFSYVALATLFVATIPLNGFLLQNAVTVSLEPATLNDTILVPMLNGEQFGYLQQVQATGDASDGGVFDWSPGLGALSQIVTPKIDATVDLSSFNTTCLGSCKTSVQGMGFSIRCEDTLEAYNIPALLGDANTDLTTPEMTAMFANGTDVATVDVTYNYLKTNTITVRSMWKNSPDCKGNYTVQTCDLDLATVEYPIIINSGIQKATQNGLQNTTVMVLAVDLLQQQPKVVNITTSEFVNNTKFTTYPVAGLAGLFAQTFNSSINMYYNPTTSYYGTNFKVQGLFAQQQLVTSGDIITAFPSCEGTVGNISQQALATIQSMMFQLGTYNWLSSYGNSTDLPNIGSYAWDFTYADSANDNVARPIAVQSYLRNEYRIVWPWYFGAMAVTILVSLAILPTFWGYWRLERKTTMSPFETARAFRAPRLYQEDSTIESTALIKTVGQLQIHRDLQVVTSPELIARGESEKS